MQSYFDKYFNRLVAYLYGAKKVLFALSIVFSLSVVSSAVFAAQIGLDLSFEKGTGTTSPQIVFTGFPKNYSLSYIRVKFGEHPFETFGFSSSTAKVFVPARYPGEQVVIAEAYDADGNKLIVLKELNIETIDAPKITDIPLAVEKDQMLVIHGSAFPSAQINIYLRGEGEKEERQSVLADVLGNFQLIWTGPMASGRYFVSAEAVNQSGVISPRSLEKQVNVNRSVLFTFGSMVVTIGSFVMFMIVVLIGIVYGGLIIWKHFHKFRRGISRDMEMIDRSVHTAFHMLKDEIHTEVRALEKAKTKRKLTREEERIIEKFSTDIDDAERFIEKQITDIKRKV